MKGTIVDFLILRANFNEELHNAILSYDTAYVAAWLEKEYADEDSIIKSYTKIAYDVKELALQVKKNDKEIQELLKAGIQILGF